jgi:hypothetical protein
MIEKRNIPITEFLASKGIRPVQVRNHSAWYHSPFRKERTPSFKVDLNKNLWFDFGEGQGGNLYKLVRRFTNARIEDILKDLSSVSEKIPEVKAGPGPKNEMSGLTIRPLTNEMLIRYCWSRRIPRDIACRYLKEAHYTIAGKAYYALAFQNDKGGYELRNRYFKGSSSPKYITTIQGQKKEIVSVFEGFFDFLSFLVHFKIGSPKGTVIILNSVSFVDKISPQLAQFKHIHIFLDNDEAGRTAGTKIISLGGKVTDHSHLIYSRCKDFNEFLLRETALNFSITQQIT